MEKVSAACRRLRLRHRHIFSAAEAATCNTIGNCENGVGTFEKKVLPLSLTTAKPSAACRRLRRERSTPTTAGASKTRGENEDQVRTFKEKLPLIPPTTEKASAVYRRLHQGPEHKASIRRLIRAGKFSRIDEIVQHQKQFPDIKDEHFTARLITIYGKAKMLDHALTLFDEMPDLNCPRTAVSFNALLAACIPSQKFDQLMELFRELQAKTSIEPDVISYTSAVKALCKKESLDDAVSLVEEMAARGVDPDAATFYVLLRHLYSSGRFSEGEKVWDLMKEKKVDPDLRCYNSRLQGMMSEKLFSQGLELVKEMQQNWIKPNSFTYNSLIKAFVDEENAEEVKKDLRGKEIGSDEIETGIDWAMVLCKTAAHMKIRICRKIVKRVSDELVKNSRVEEAKQLLHLFNLPS